MQIGPAEQDGNGALGEALAGDVHHDEGETARRTWKRNERLVYSANFLHMTMYTMCLGSVFDIFLYNLSQEQQVLVPVDLQIGDTAAPAPALPLSTHSNFVLTFDIRPSEPIAGYPANSSCREQYTCGTSVLHITDLAGNGDCCKVGNRMPLVLLSNMSTLMHLAMDAVGQKENVSVREYDKRQKCEAGTPLPVNAWSSIKVKASGIGSSKGQFGKHANNSGGLALFINGRKECEVMGTQYRSLPARASAWAFLGSISSPETSDVHVPANAEIRNLKYGKPASNLFVGTMNSVQGVVSVLLMYPIGWLGDYTNRYNLNRFNVAIGVLAALLMVTAVFLRNTMAIFAGVILFTFYQQCISAIMYAILADNVDRQRRTQAGVNYKTFSTLAQSLGVLVQLIVVLIDPAQDNWSWSTFSFMLLPGWLLLPGVALVIFAIRPVGEKIADTPNVDEVPLNTDVVSVRSARLNQAWLDDIVIFGQRRGFVVAVSVNAFFILTLLANGMTSRYFSLYFTQIKKFSPAGLCLLNAVCRLWIAIFAQLGKPLGRIIGRSNLIVILHVGAALCTLGVYGGGLFEPSMMVACASYLMRFALLQTRDPLLYSVTMDCVPPSQRSRWAALNSLRTLSFAASAVLGGYLADMHGYEFSFNITVIALLCGLVVFLPAIIWFPRREGAQRQEQPNLNRNNTTGGGFWRALRPTTQSSQRVVPPPNVQASP